MVPPVDSVQRELPYHLNKDYLRRLGLKAPQQTTRQRWPDWSVLGGRFAPFWVAGFDRFRWPLSSVLRTRETIFQLEMATLTVGHKKRVFF